MARGRYRRVFILAALATVVAWFGLRAAVEAIDGTPDTRGARVVRFSVDSKLVGRKLGQIGIVRHRAGDAPPPLLVLLHGREDGGDGPRSMLTDALFAGLKRLGASAPAVLLVNGGKSSYYHDRSSGRWGAYVLREAIPAGIAKLGADPGRVAIGGISMGGFGALWLGSQQRFCAVGGHSPALWMSGGETPAGAFDDGEDFDRVTPLTHPPLTKRVWLDVGTNDPFRIATTKYGRRVGARVRVWPGGHEGAYWQRHMGSYLRFYARALADCGA
jgi:poly(3-hydroxybutyrate) depolymerase